MKQREESICRAVTLNWQRLVGPGLLSYPGCSSIFKTTCPTSQFIDCLLMLAEVTPSSERVCSKPLSINQVVVSQPYRVGRKNKYYILFFYCGMRENLKVYLSFRLHVLEVTCAMWLLVEGVKCLFQPEYAKEGHLWIVQWEKSSEHAEFHPHSWEGVSNYCKASQHCIGYPGEWITTISEYL